MSLTLKPRTTIVILFQGDDFDPIAERLEQIQRAAISNVPRRQNDPSPTEEAVRDYDQFADEAVDRAVKVQLVALGRRGFREILAKHPARMVPEDDAEDGKQPRLVLHEDDAANGFNTETLGDDLVPACIADGQFDTVAERDAFVDGLSDGDFSKLYSAALNLNRSLGPDPKARLSSHLEPISDETSQSPERLA